MTGFEPARVYPNGFQVHRLNHSATTTDMHNAITACYINISLLVRRLILSTLSHGTHTDEEARIQTHTVAKNYNHRESCMLEEMILIEQVVMRGEETS